VNTEPASTPTSGTPCARRCSPPWIRSAKQAWKTSPARRVVARVTCAPCCRSLPPPTLAQALYRSCSDGRPSPNRGREGAHKCSTDVGTEIPRAPLMGRQFQR